VLPAPPRSGNRYRKYPPEALDRVRLIRGALAMGFTIAELASILKVRDRGGAPCRQVRELAAAKLSELEIQLNEMMRLRDELGIILKDWDSRLSSTPPGGRAALLESLAEPRPGRAHRLSVLKRKGNHK